MKLKFIITVWGKEYIKDFNNTFLNSFDNELTFEAVKNNLSSSSSLTIYTKENEKDLFDNERLKKINQNIKVEFKYLDNIFSKIDKSKYQFLSSVQNIIINLSHDCDYLSFVYPDFIFTKNSIYNCINLIKKNNYSAIFAPVPRVIKEKSNKVNEIIENGLNKHIKNNLHIFDKTSFTNNLRHNPSLITMCLDEFWIYKNFHIHPIILKNLNNKNYYSSFSPSIDEDFIQIYDKTKYYVAKDSDEMLFSSMTKLSEMNINFIPFNSYTFANWGNEHLRNIHLKIFKENNYILKFSNDISEDYLNREISNFEKYIKDNFFYLFLDKEILDNYYTEFKNTNTKKFISLIRKDHYLQKVASKLKYSMNAEEFKNKNKEFEFLI